MTSSVALAERERLSNPRRRRDAAKSAEAARMVSDLLALPPEIRREVLSGMDPSELSVLLAVTEKERGTPFALWVDDPVGFIEDVLGENLWSKPREILRSIPLNTRTAVPSCFGSSKTWSTSRTALWWSSVHPAGTAVTVTIAPIWRQVQRQIWPEIRKAHKQAGLPGRVDQTQMKVLTPEGLEFTCAYGVSANPHQESAVQGIHAPHLLLVVDEAGGIAHTVGKNLRALLTGDDARMVAIGNPPTDNEGSWFETLCSTDGVNVIPISAYSTPNLTDERAPRCRSCPSAVPAHSLATHLVEQTWVAETIADYGADAPYVIAKVHAKFPKGGSARIIPSSWIEAAMDSDEPEAADAYVRICDLDLPDETEEWMVKLGAWVRLGVDVAADGGDELVIARSIGNLGSIQHTSSGSANANPTDVAGKILEHIKRAERVRGALGTSAPVRVKIDGIGVGWGVAGILKAWKAEGLHTAEIVVVIVSESTGRDNEGATLRPSRKRDEMWLAGRDLLQPRAGEDPQIRLRIDRRTQAQLAGPTYGTSASGRTVVESKDSLRRRGIPSPDRAESLLMAFYEPLVEDEDSGPRLLV